jgi:hypothetical protein
MRRDPTTRHHDSADETKDVELENGCILCGGNLALRVTASGARSICRSCMWISRPQMQRHEDGNVHVTHPAGGAA